MRHVLRMSAAHTEAITTLRETIRAAQSRGHSIPCFSASGTDWTSDTAGRQKTAARRCQSCPALKACNTAGQFEAGAVWGGKTRSDRTRWQAERARKRAADKRLERDLLDELEGTN